MTVEKRVAYQASNSYSVLNPITEQTRNFWMVFHGMGYLSTYFLNYFKGLDPDLNTIVAPQAPSKYYQTNEFKHVGASWLTRVDTENETENVLAYVNSVWQAERPDPELKLFILGYSQGMSIATRWMARSKIQCDHLILHSGAHPKEFTPSDFDYLSEETRVSYLLGTKDHYITPERKIQESARAAALFQNRLSIREFEGNHEVATSILKEFSEE